MGSNTALEKKCRAKLFDLPRIKVIVSTLVFNSFFIGKKMPNKFKPLAHGIHQHSDYSLDGGASADGMIKRAKQLGRPACVLTDHGEMSGLIPHYFAAKKAGIQSIHGIELYIWDEKRPLKEYKNGKLEPSYTHQTVLFKTQEAYEYMCKMTPIMNQRAVVKFGERKPLLKIEELEPIAGQIVLGSGCFLSGTKVLTRDGLRNIEQIKSGDIIYNRLGEEAKVLAPTMNEYKGDTYHIKTVGSARPIIATGNHKFLAIRNGSCVWVEAKDLVNSEKLVQSVPKYKNNERYFHYDFISVRERFNQKISFDLQDPETLWVMGLFLAEGSFNSHTKKSINFSLNVKETGFLDRIKKWATKFDMNVGWYPSKKSNGAEATINSKALYGAFLSLFGGKETKSDTKFIPLCIKQQPVSSLRFLIDGYLSGDGYFGFVETGEKKLKNYNQAVASVSEQLIEDMMEILRRADVHYSMSVYKGKATKWGNKKDAYYLKNHGEDLIILKRWINGESRPDVDWVYTKITKISKKHYHGVVHCLAVDGEEKNFSLQNGLVVHNCLIGFAGKSINDWNLTPAERLSWAEQSYLELKKYTSDPLLVEIFPHATTHNWKKPKDQPGYFYEILEKNHVCDHGCSTIQHVFDECGHLTVPVDLQKRQNEFMIHMARKYGDLLVISEDSHLGTEEDYLVQNAKLGNGDEKFKFYNKYIMGESDQWAKNLQSTLGLSDYDIEEMIDNSYKSLEFFKNYKVRTNKDEWLVPTAEQVYGYEVRGKSNKEIVQDLIVKHGRMPSPDNPKYQAYKDRLDYEISVFADNGKVDLLPYFFPVEEAVQWAKERGELTATRGSASGSLLVYLLGMSITDPIKYNLPFERMISIARINANTMPDADTDWEDRGPILEHIFEKYGDYSSLIGTDLSMKLKTSILDCERAELGEVRQETMKLSKSLPQPPQGVSHYDWLNGYKLPDGTFQEGFLKGKEYTSVRLRAWIDENPGIWEMVLRCLGITKSRGIHAGGVLITPKPVQSYAPILHNKAGPVCGLNMKWAEEVGLIKYDFLGVSTLKALGIAARALYRDTGVKIEWEEKPHDPRVYQETYHKGKLAGLFQVDTPSMAPFVSKIKPKNINDISNLVALVRPGSLDAPAPDPVLAKDGMTAAEYFAKAHSNIVKPYYIHEDLEPILKESYGCILFQEQTMRIFHDIAGYSWEQCDLIRRGVSKKDPKVMSENVGKLSKVCIEERGWSKSQISQLTETIQASASYSFNKAHSASYAILSYDCAWWKVNYPQYYWLGMFSIATDDHDTLKHYLTEAGDYALPVDIFKSHPTDWAIEGDRVRAPLSLLKGCGSLTVEKIRTVMQTPMETLRAQKLAGESILEGEEDE